MMIEHRSQLRARVEDRRAELGKALGVAERDAQPAERLEALRTELQVVTDSTSGGWETMTDVTAAQLSLWLEATRFLVEDVAKDRSNAPTQPMRRLDLELVAPMGPTVPPKA